MDVKVTSDFHVTHKMFSYENFEEVFDVNIELSYCDELTLEILANRKALHGLFIERILELLGIEKPSKIFPPKSSNGIQILHKAVIESSGTDHHKLSVFYYVLLEYDRVSNRSDFSKEFERKSFLPKKYQTFIRGLWHIDHQEFEIALPYLAHPSLIPSFTDEILEVLTRASKNNMSLPLAYYHTVQPGLLSQSAIDLLFSALARTNVSEAFHFTHTRNEYCQQHLFKLLIRIVLDEPPSDWKADRCFELIGIAFTSQEEAWFEEYLLHGEGKGLKGAKDTVLMRYLGSGNIAKFISFKDTDSKTINGLDWGVITNAIKAGLGSRQAV